MAATESAPGDQQTYSRVGYTMLGGLWISIAVMLIGLLLAAVEGTKQATQVLPLDQVVPHLFKGQPVAVVDLGILLLFATPLVGVLVASVEFLRQRDLAQVLVTGLLLVILAIGFAVALH